MQGGDQLVPNKVALDRGSQIASFEAANPVRRFAWEGKLGTTELTPNSFDAWRPRLDAMLENAVPPKMRTLEGGTGTPRELAILRLTSGADLSSQKYGTQSAFGWSILHVTKQADMPRVNRVSYFIHSAANNTFTKVKTVDVDRTKSIPSRGAENPTDALFDW
jgi:hypothetical protein